MVFCLLLKLAKKPQNYVWLEQKRVAALSKKRRWMRRGGFVHRDLAQDTTARISSDIQH
jgi:hypothetical protein